MLALLAMLSVNSCYSPSTPAPDISVETYQFPDSFRLSLVAAEPLLDAPVAISFDERGRIWVVEMRGYMTDLDNSGENQPSGRISILDDRDGDGIMDHRTIFLDCLVLPRALALVYGGLLYAEPPNLWFVNILGDRPGDRTLVDSAYATGGNVEHQPNGLLLAMDNWIYSAKSDLRYRRRNGRWLREKTRFRGQWGIAQDDAGRLFYNDNSNQLQGDWILPNAMLRNRYFTPTTGYNIQICTDQRVWPLHPTAVNRGYETSMLDAAGRLRNVTSACGPVIYRGGQFPSEFTGNAFVCAPEANLVKRNIFDASAPLCVQARQASPGEEFLASADPGFRPVNLCEGPDGCLYIVDMHRGIIQHKTYMTAYLREQITRQRLDTIAGQGRILRVAHARRTPPQAFVPGRAGTAQLVQYLGAPIPWLRDKARQLLIERADTTVAAALWPLTLDNGDPQRQLQSLWALEGLDMLAADRLLRVAAGATQAWVRLTALHLLESRAGAAYTAAALTAFNELFARADSVADLGLCLYAGPWARLAPAPVFDLLLREVQRYPRDTFFQEAMVSGLSGLEATFLNFLIRNTHANQAVFLKKTLYATAENRRQNRPASWTEVPKPVQDTPTRGLHLYNTHCSPCHGASGQGTPNLAPPLAGSEFVHGNPEKLILIALHGLKGPVRVRGRRYDLNAGMPGFAANPDCTDSDLAAILSFVRNAFSREPMVVSAEKVNALRQTNPADGSVFTVEELTQLGVLKR